MKITFVVVYFACMMLLGCGENPETWPIITFDKEKWDKAGEEKRYVFTRDLIAKKRLIGMKRQEIINVLGPPPFDDSKTNYITYVVKISSGSVFILDIRFKQGVNDLVVDEVFIRAD